MLFKRPQGLEICLAGLHHLHNFYCPNIYTPQPTVNLLPEAGGKKWSEQPEYLRISAKKTSGPSQRTG